MNAISRRTLLGGALGAAAVGGLEGVSLFGAFDHRVPVAGSKPERVRAALAAPTPDAVVHIGHSTHLIELDGKRLLTDPWFSDPAFGALEHTRPAACSESDLGSIDALLVSHEHPDHADLVALDRFPSKAMPVLVPTRELAAKLRSRGFRNVHALEAWQSFALGSVTLHAVPALHDVAEIGFVLAGTDARVYFAGDTAFHSAFDAIRERLRPSFALLPVDGTRLRGSSHATLDALEAVRVAALLGVRGALPSHAEARYTDPFAAHVLTTTSPASGPERFAREMARALPAVRCFIPHPGDRVELTCT